MARLLICNLTYKFVYVTQSYKHQDMVLLIMLKWAVIICGACALIKMHFFSFSCYMCCVILCCVMMCSDEYFDKRQTNEGTILLTFQRLPSLRGGYFSTDQCLFLIVFFS